MANAIVHKGAVMVEFVHTVLAIIAVESLT
jgi:hypothetical protein